MPAVKIRWGGGQEKVDLHFGNDELENVAVAFAAKIGILGNLLVVS